MQTVKLKEKLMKMVIDLDLQKDSPMERYLRLVIDLVKRMEMRMD